MAPTDGRVAKPERRWGCRRGTLSSSWQAISELRGVTRSGVTQFYLQLDTGKYTPP